MERNNISDIIESGQYIECGTYEAYAKAKEIILNCYDGGYKLISLSNNVTISEFLEAVKILMAFASNHPDEHIELYRCSTNCKYFKIKQCPGECLLSVKSTKRCPFCEE